MVDFNNVVAALKRKSLGELDFARGGRKLND